MAINNGGHFQIIELKTQLYLKDHEMSLRSLNQQLNSSYVK